MSGWRSRDGGNRVAFVAARRRLVSLAMALIGGAACANQGAPPGGPPDASPPLVLAVTPSTNSVGARVKEVQLRFDEVISESPRGQRDLSQLVFISPRSGTPRVDWGRTRLSIRPSRGWKPNTVYSVVIKPGIMDLRNNALDTAIRVVFSTGGPIPDTHVRGAVFDWGLGRGLGNAVVEAITEDSTIYQTVADSAGRFDLANVPPGSLLLRAFGDRNGNQELDPLEIWDSVRVTLTQQLAADFYTFQHDTVGLRIAAVATDTSRTIKLTFDKPYSPEQVFNNTLVKVKRADSTEIPVILVQTARERFVADSLRAKVKADSIERVARAKEDSTPGLRARNDSLARLRRADSIAAADRQRREEERAAQRAAQREGRRLPTRRDTMPPPRMERPAVYTELFVTLETPLPPQSQFRVQVLFLRSLADVVKSPSRVFTTPRAPRPDSTRPPPGNAPPPAGTPPAGRPPR